MGAGPNATIRPRTLTGPITKTHCLSNAAPQRVLTTCLPHLVQGLVYITETAEQGSNTPSPSRKHGDSTRDPDLTLAISNERCRLERTVAERTGAVTCRTQRARAQDSGSTNAPVAPALLRAARGGGFSFTPFPTRFHGQRPGSGRGLAPGSGGEPWGAFGPPY